mgnify:CR=1 FL=1
MELTFGDAFDVDPKVTIRRGSHVPFVEMADVKPWTRTVRATAHRAFSGGSKFVDSDVLLARITPSLENGKTSIYNAATHEKDQPAAGSTEFIVIRGKRDVSLSEYAYYLLRTDELRNHLVANMNGSSGRQRVRAEALHGFPIALPDISTQKRTVELLSLLDDKIDSNRSASQMLNSLSNLLAEKMLHSGPTQTVPLSKLANFNTKNIRRDQFNEIEYVDIKGTGQGHIDSTIRFDATSAPSRARRLVSDGDVIYSTVRPNRQVYSPIFSPPPNLVVSTGFAVATPTNIAGTSFISYIFQQNSFSQYLSASASGSAYPAASIGSISSYPVVIPTDISKLKSYESSTQRMRRLAMTLHQQDRRLAELRDTLLPELMSGRMRVDEAGRLVADAFGKESVDD